MLPAVLGFIGGFFSAVFAEPLRRWLFRPNLVLEFKKAIDFVVRTPEDGGMPHQAIVVRVKVTNTSSGLARGCRAYLVNIEKQAASGWERTVYCDNLQLGWSARGDKDYAALDLPKNVPHFIDVVSSRELSTEFRPAIAVTPYRYQSLFRSIGTHRFTLVVSGDEVKPTRIAISFNWGGSWSDLEDVGEVEPAA